MHPILSTKCIKICELVEEKSSHHQDSQSGNNLQDVTTHHSLFLFKRLTICMEMLYLQKYKM